jgi:hypothetical protein
VEDVLGNGEENSAPPAGTDAFFAGLVEDALADE